MPHIIINGLVNFDLIHSNFKGRIIRSTIDGGCIYNFKESFQSVSKDTILINTITIESRFTPNYFIQLIKKSDKITERLYPVTHPEYKTSSIKRSLVIIAKTILESDTRGESFITKSNLQHFLKKKSK
jgi:hypothetical protein